MLQEVSGNEDITFNLDGEVVGPLGSTEIAENVIDGENIKDHSIGEEEINSSEIQLRITEECPEGYYIRSVEENGEIVCGKPTVEQADNDLNLEDVLSNGNDANNRDIKGVDELEADKIKTDKLCLSGDCKNSWPEAEKGEIFTKYRYLEGTPFSSTYGRSYFLGSKEEYDICALMGVYDNDCKVYYDSNQENWILKVEGGNGKCMAACYKLNLNYTSSKLFFLHYNHK